MSLDLGDLIEGLCNLMDIGPFKSKSYWPQWRRGLWCVLQIVWWSMIVLFLLVIISLWVS